MWVCSSGRRLTLGISVWVCVVRHIAAQIFFVVLCDTAKERSVLHHCRIREDLGLLGVDIWLKPCQSIGWLSGIDRCAEKPTCLFVFQSTGCTGAFTRLHVSDICCFTLSAPADMTRLCLDSYIYFSDLGATFTAAQLFFFMPVCDSPSLTHC